MCSWRRALVTGSGASACCWLQGLEHWLRWHKAVWVLMEGAGLGREALMWWDGSHGRPAAQTLPVPRAGRGWKLAWCGAGHSYCSLEELS